MSLNKLKTIAFKYISEDKELCKEARRSLLRYIKEDASSYEIKEYLMDGEMSSNLDNDSLDIIDKRFNHLKDKILSKVDQQLNEFVRIGTAYIRTTLGQEEVQDLKDNYETCKETNCDNLGGRKYNLCKAKCKLQSLQQNRELLEDAINECDNSKNPENCRNKIRQSLEKLDSEISDTEDKINHLQDLIEEE